jgi:tetratricopeptide (TPR) repeat protein
MLVAAGRCRAARAITLAPPLSPLTAYLATLIQDALGPDYRIEQELDGGGMSRLFMATDLRHNRRVVVKVLSPELVTDTSTARFKREIELTVRLQHPHILPILTSGARDDALYYITPFIPGESLKARIERDGKLPLDDIIKILRDASGALAFAHACGVVHRDVKPGNILLAEGHAILADFGIARAVGTQTSQLTVTGVMPGTPAYMAPELPTEEAGDVYALGVVAYEMLVGKLPKRGVTPREIVDARGAVAGDIRARVGVLAELICSVTARSPHAGVSTADDFCKRMDTLDAPRRGARRRVAIAFASIAVALGAGLIAALRRHSQPLEPDRWVVLPVSTGGTATGTATDTVTARATEEAADAIGEWQGLSIADPSLVASAVAQTAGRSLGPHQAAAIARAAGARNLVTVESKGVGDSISIRATLYDAASDTAMKARRMTISRRATSTDRLTAMRRLANQLVRSGSELPWLDASDRRSPSLVAWRSYDAGRDAIRGWDLAAAERLFRSAIDADPGLGVAQVALAQTLHWATPRQTVPEGRAALRRALNATRTLSTRDSLHAAAALSLADSQYVRACQGFYQLIQHDSTDLVAWIGAGDCAAENGEVRRDPSTRTGWAFVGSFEAAARAYQRANELAPGRGDTPFRGWLLGRLSFVLFTITNKIRTGYQAGPLHPVVVALPFLDHDTLAFAPYLASGLASGRFDPPPELVRAAVVRSRAGLREAAEEWVRRSPQSAAAYDSLASWAEVSGGMGLVGDRQVPTIEIVRAALRLSRDSTQRVRLGVSEVRLLVKLGRFSEARQTADSLLRGDALRRAGAVNGVAGLAAMLGRLEQTATLWAGDPEGRRPRLADGSPVDLPEQLAEASSRLTAYTALGGPPDSISALAERTMGLIASYVPNEPVAAQLRASLVAAGLTFTYPDGGQIFRGLGEGADEVTKAFSLFAHGDTAGARAKLSAIQRLRKGKESGLSIDGTFRRARLAMLLGDTTGAIAELDPVLRALPGLSPSLFRRVAEIASLVRSFELRAEIADHAHDAAVRRQSAAAVASLWKGADPLLHQRLVRMESLAR